MTKIIDMGQSQDLDGSSSSLMSDGPDVPDESDIIFENDEVVEMEDTISEQNLTVSKASKEYLSNKQEIEVSPYAQDYSTILSK